MACLYGRSAPWSAALVAWSGASQTCMLSDSEWLALTRHRKLCPWSRREREGMFWPMGAPRTPKGTESITDNVAAEKLALSCQSTSSLGKLACRPSCRFGVWPWPGTLSNSNIGPLSEMRYREVQWSWGCRRRSFAVKSHTWQPAPWSQRVRRCCFGS